MLHGVSTTEQLHLLVFIYCLEVVSLAWNLLSIGGVGRKDKDAVYALFVQESQSWPIEFTLKHFFGVICEKFEGIFYRIC